MTPEKLREIYGYPAEIPANKEIFALDRHCREFIAQSTYLVMATSNGVDLDISPKGDPKGFVQIEDDNNLLIPDRPGNARIDGLLNIIAHPKVGLLFTIPTVAETLRINGRAEILDDPDICAHFAINNRNPKTVLRVTAEQIFLHCGKASVRAGLWKTETWPETRPVATLYEIIQDHAKVQVPGTDQAAVDKRYLDTLY